MPKGLILIPARFQSSRFPGKPLAKIAGKTLIERVYANAVDSGLDCYVVTDNDEIATHLEDIKANYLRVDDELQSGSDRIYLAYQRFLQDGGYSHVMNLQGDEPLFSGKEIKALFDFHSTAEFDISTVLLGLEQNHQDLNNPNAVKVAFEASTKRCLYFSRNPIPCFHREQGKWYKHIGVYLYRVKALEQYFNLSPTTLEVTESLEQLRALAHGLSLGGYVTTTELHGVDKPEDIPIVEGVLSGQEH